MAECLIALGSNLGDRAENLRRALDELDRVPGAMLAARSAWHETSPVGGPAGQAPFLNGAARLITELEPAALLAELIRIETQLGRVRDRRWEARTIDLDILLYGATTTAAAELEIPHPRMHYRRFVLAPAAEVAPWMIHPPSAWTVGQLERQLDRGDDAIAVAATDPHLGAWLVDELTRGFPATGAHRPQVRLWTPELTAPRRPRLIVAAPGAPGVGEPQRRRMLQLPATGPVAWLTAVDANEALTEASAAIASAWPDWAAGRSGN